MFSSSYNQVFDPCCVKNCCPHINIGNLKSLSKQLAISYSVLFHISANPFCFGIFGMVFSRLTSSNQYILTSAERKSFALSCLSFMGVLALRTTFFSLASASLLALSKSTRTNFVYWSANKMQKRNPNSDSTLKVPITIVNALFNITSAVVSVTPDADVFEILANAHTLHTSSSELCTLRLLQCLLNETHCL